MSFQSPIIPEDHPISLFFEELASSSVMVVFSGLPGVGKSLYINEFYRIAQAKNKNVTVIQWDLARKAFELPAIMHRFPMHQGRVHAGVKLMAGQWLLNTIKKWYRHSNPDTDILLIEAPLVGHRFIEIVNRDVPAEIKPLVIAPTTQIIVPIPTKKIRKLIEEARKRDVPENVKEWKGAKPSVMQTIWEDVVKIAIRIGYNKEVPSSMPYDPEIYRFVFEKVCRHRYFKPLMISDTFDSGPATDEDLHALDSLMAEPAEALQLFGEILDTYQTDQAMEDITNSWFLR